MKRDLNLIREILLHVESGNKDRQIKGYSLDAFRYHGRLAIEAGLVHGNVSQTVTGEIPQVVLYELTWEGHDFLDAARNKTIWKRVNAKLLKVSGGVTFGVLKELLIQTAKQEIGLT